MGSRREPGLVLSRWRKELLSEQEESRPYVSYYKRVGQSISEFESILFSSPCSYASGKTRMFVLLRRDEPYCMTKTLAVLMYKPILFPSICLLYIHVIFFPDPRFWLFESLPNLW